MRISADFSASEEHPRQESGKNDEAESNQHLDALLAITRSPGKMRTEEGDGIHQAECKDCDHEINAYGQVSWHKREQQQAAADRHYVH